MSDAVDVTEFEEETGHHYRCMVADLDLTAEQRTKLETACARRADISTGAIHRVLISWDRRLGMTTIDKHRKGDCACKR